MHGDEVSLVIRSFCHLSERADHAGLILADQAERRPSSEAHHVVSVLGVFDEVRDGLCELSFARLSGGLHQDACGALLCERRHDFVVARVADRDLPIERRRDLFASVNISARHLYHRRLPAEVLALLGKYNVNPERLVLEITESQHLPSSPIWKDTADQLRTLGIGLAMDDLGTGYATVEQLLAVPFSHVKVDQVLTHSLDRAGTAELAAAIASIARGAGMTAIIEGIETSEELAAMITAGYRYGQGFHFHRPEPLADAVTTIVSPTPHHAER